MNLDISYVPTFQERRRAIVHSWFVWLLYAGLAGAVIAVVGIGGLSRAAARHGEATGVSSLAAVGGALLAFLPALVNMWSLRSVRRDHTERRINLTSTRIRVEIQGVATEVPWEKVTRFRETPQQWIFYARRTCLVIPKRAVPAEQSGQLGEFLRAL